MKKNTLKTVGLVSLSLGLLMVMGGLTQFTITANSGNQLASIQNVVVNVETNDAHSTEDSVEVLPNHAQTDAFNIREIVEKVREGYESEN